MDEFFSQDFSDTAMKKKVLKNAYHLLGKREHQRAAALFFLAGHPENAVRVSETCFSLNNQGCSFSRKIQIAGNLNNFQLSILSTDQRLRFFSNIGFLVSTANPILYSSTHWQSLLLLVSNANMIMTWRGKIEGIVTLNTKPALFDAVY